MKENFNLILLSVLILFFYACSTEVEQKNNNDIHPWEMVEIVLNSENAYDNYYTDVTCWVDLEGPNFSKRIYGFWDGGDTFKVRIVATEAGLWNWTSGSNQQDNGLNNQTGSFNAIAWTKQEMEQNPNRRGFIQPTPNGQALEYADGTPFFLIGDTWLAASTWRLPYRNEATSDDYIPGPGIGFEDAVNYRKNQGFNSVSFISCFPSWEADENASTYADENGIYIRNAWEKFGYPTEDGQMTAKDMRDELGNKPFEMLEEQKGVPNFDQIIPEYFQSLDKKMQHLSDVGFVPLIETVRRDICPAWKAYFDFNESYSRFVQYLISRYGAHNILFSGIHLDWIPKEYSLTADEFNEALTYHLDKYGPLPFGKIHTTLINNSTLWQFGHGENCPWLTMHSVGNKPRDHAVSIMIDSLFNLQPAYPAINFEPYYTGWDHEINMPGGERPPANSARDNYFARAMMYCSVLSGGLSGHVHGTAAYDITTTGEPNGMRPHIWDALKYESAEYMHLLTEFVLSEGDKYQDLKPAHNDINPQKASGSLNRGLDGWSYMIRTEEKDFALLYFENKAVLPELNGFTPNTNYSLIWFDPIKGDWKTPIEIKSDENGRVTLAEFPNGQNPTNIDWALKIIESK